MYRFFLEGSEVARIRRQKPSRHAPEGRRLVSGISGALMFLALG